MKMNPVACLFLAGVVASTATGAARADIVEYNDTSALSTNWFYNSFGPAFMLDDAQFGSAATNVSITGIQFGYANHDSAAHNVDAVVSFFGNMNTSATGSTPVNTNLLGSATFDIGTVPAGGGSGTPAMGVTGPLSISTPIVVPNNAFGVEINFYNHGTTILSTVDALLVTLAPTTGSTLNGYWSDDSDTYGVNDGVFHSDDFVAAPGSSNLNMYLELTGTPTPEPAGLSVLGAAGLLLMRRRKCRPA